jgi:hypothetical protein
MEGGASPVNKFRDSLNGFKRPYIERLEEYQPKTGDDDPMDESDIQNVGLIKDALKQIDMLYLILEAALRNNGTNQRPDLEAKAVCSVFEKNGSFAEIRRDPSLKEEFLKYLKLDLKVFPFTLNTRLIDSFMRNGVEPHQREGLSHAAAP